jgi:uncharacterized membrane protein YcaP (DUF421 family)
MDSVLRALAMYAFLVVVFRLSGRRTLSEATPFDLMMLLVISETTQQAMVDDDHSMTHAGLLVLTFVTTNILLSLIKQHSKRAERVLDDVPLIVLVEGRPLKERLDRARVDVHDILHAARENGLERLDQIKYAVLEASGGITIVPRE